MTKYRQFDTPTGSTAIYQQLPTIHAARPTALTNVMNVKQKFDFYKPEQRYHRSDRSFYYDKRGPAVEIERSERGAPGTDAQGGHRTLLLVFSLLNFGLLCIARVLFIPAVCSFCCIQLQMVEVGCGVGERSGGSGRGGGATAGWCGSAAGARLAYWMK